MNSLAESYTDFPSFVRENLEESNVAENVSSGFNLKETPLKEKLSHIGMGKVADTAISTHSESVERSKSIDAVLSKAVTRTSEILENEFFCVIRNVDGESQTITADVYDIADNVQVMDITADFSEFLESERKKIAPNAGFYWRIGSRNMTVKRPKDNSEYQRSSVFSEFRMRLTYVSPRSLKGRLESKVRKHSSLFS